MRRREKGSEKGAHFGLEALLLFSSLSLSRGFLLCFASVVPLRCLFWCSLKGVFAPPDAENRSPQQPRIIESLPHLLFIVRPPRKDPSSIRLLASPSDPSPIGFRRGLDLFRWVLPLTARTLPALVAPFGASGERVVTSGTRDRFLGDGWPAGLAAAGERRLFGRFFPPDADESWPVGGRPWELDSRWASHRRCSAVHSADGGVRAEAESRRGVYPEASQEIYRHWGGSFCRPVFSLVFLLSFNSFCCVMHWVLAAPVLIADDCFFVWFMQSNKKLFFCSCFLFVLYDSDSAWYYSLLSIRFFLGFRWGVVLLDW